MWSFFKKLTIISLTFFVLAYIFNIKVGDKTTRHWASEIWQSDIVQKSYTRVRDKIKALLSQEISLEEIFNSGSDRKKTNKEVNKEYLDKKDQQKLDRLLNQQS